MKPWYEVYDLISKGLFGFSEKCKSKGQKSGEELFTSLSKNREFRVNNTWIDKFEKDFNIKSLDPFHIFASISAGGLKEENRIKRINIILEHFELSPYLPAINFDGCPSPMAVYLVSARDVERQIEIWDLFERVYSHNVKGLKRDDFTNFKKWYGVEYNSLTVFLFWVNSNYFLPFDKNTELYLTQSTGYIKSKPKAFTTYTALLNRIQKFNSSEHEQFGSFGIFREIAFIAYQVISHNIIDTPLSTGLVELLKENSLSNENSYENRAGIGFKLIAIKPLDGCKYLNNLKSNKVYHFEKTIEIEGDQITYYRERNIDLYRLNNGLQINVTAIVGKNGSGKSSLIELFFRIINNISFSLKESLKTRKLKVEHDINAELYYTNLGILHKIIIDGTSVLIQDFNLEGNASVYIPIGDSRPLQKKDLNSFFYTVAVNYSHYALNSNILGEWIQSLFHKNDAYQTPIVINPMRTHGNIDINSENDLATARLISNLLEPITDDTNIGLRQVTEKQIALRLVFKHIPNKNKILFTREMVGQKYEEIPFTTLDKEKNQLILKHLKEVFEFPKEHKNENSILINDTTKYIIRKLARISLNYFLYKDYFNEKNVEFDKDRISEYLFALKNDTSHITYKLKQAINYWKYSKLWGKEAEISISIKEASERLQTFFRENHLEESKIIEFIPPSIFKAELFLDNENKIPNSFNLLSSGEKQLIYSASSILYHLQNLDSVDDKRGLIKYHNVCLLLDEIELYYHPDLQRKYIDFLLSVINKIEFKNITAINICMVTHSPYVLSDIPDIFTLKLEDGKPNISESKTFGANIHELLTHSFFMDSTTGEYAKKKIKEIIEFHYKVKIATGDNLQELRNQYERKKDEYEFIVQNIGEELISGVLKNHLDFIKENLSEQINESKTSK